MTKAESLEEQFKKYCDDKYSKSPPQAPCSTIGKDSCNKCQWKWLESKVKELEGGEGVSE
jgi:hypothetical protein